MSADFNHQWQCSGEQPETASHTSQDDAGLAPGMDGVTAPETDCKGDRFELLSAYLDGEVTAAERQQVETWLATDPKIQQLHTRLLTLRHEMQVFGTMQPPASAAVDDTVVEVMQRLDRRPRRVVRWGGAAIAATLIGAVTLVLSPVGRSPSGQYAETPAPSSSSTALQIALDAPVIDIPTIESDSSVTQ